MSGEPVHRRPTPAAAIEILEAAELPTADLTEAHLEHFFYCGPGQAPIGLVGVELHAPDALLRSLVIVPAFRSAGLGTVLVAHAETYAAERGARAMYLLTATAEAFFRRRGYVDADRRTAPAAIRATREFAALCPDSAAFLCKTL